MNTIDNIATEPLDTCPPEAVISGDLQCVGCGYNLRTMQVGGQCSECGLAVERSFLVLPQAWEISDAIHLASWALVVNFLGLFIPPFQVVALLMLLVSAHRLLHRCKLSGMSELARKVRWFWITIVISAIVLMLSVATELTRGEYRLLRSILGPNLSWRTRQTLGRQVTTLYHSDMAESIEITTDAQGRLEVTVLDNSGNVVSASTVAIGQSASVKDGAGRNVPLNLNTAGTLTIHARASSKIEVYPNGNILLVRLAPGLQRTLLVVALVVLGLATMILYLLMCRALVICSYYPRLARRFTMILWLIVTALAATAIMVGIWFGRITGLGPRNGAVVLTVAALTAGLSMLVAVVAQIVASLQLSSALLKAPRHWSEVAAVPGGE